MVLPDRFVDPILAQLPPDVLADPHLARHGGGLDAGGDVDGEADRGDDRDQPRVLEEPT